MPKIRRKGAEFIGNKQIHPPLTHSLTHSQTLNLFSSRDKLQVNLIFSPNRSRCRSFYRRARCTADRTGAAAGAGAR